jgi:hypothetical protein
MRHHPSHVIPVVLFLGAILAASRTANAQLGPGWIKISSDESYDYFVNRKGLERKKPVLGPEYVRVNLGHRLVRDTADERLHLIAQRARAKLNVVGYEKYLVSLEYWDVRCKSGQVSIGGRRDIDSEERVLDDDHFEQKWLTLPKNEPKAAPLRAALAWACAEAK